MKKIFALIIVLVIGVGLYAYNSNFMYPVRDVENFEKTSTKNEEVKENTIDLEVDINNQVSKPGTYEEYSANKIIEKGESGRVLLFFYASWCPSCRSLDKDINKNTCYIRYKHGDTWVRFHRLLLGVMNQSKTVEKQVFTS